MLMFAFVFIFVLILAAISDSSGDRKYDFLCKHLIIILLTLTCAIREESVGTDTSQYVQYFSIQNFGVIDWISYGLEPFFGFIVNLLNLLNFKDYFFYFLIFSYITNFFIIKSIFKLNNRFLLLSLYLGFSTLFFYNFNVVRQGVAISIFLYSIFSLFEGKLLKYSLLTLFASLFHYSALFNFIFIAIYYLGVFSSICFSVAVAFLYYLGYTYLIKYVALFSGSDKSIEYIGLLQTGGGKTQFFIILFVVFISMVLHFFVRNNNSVKPINNNIVYSLYSFLIVFQFFIAFMGLKYEGPGRIVSYYYIAYFFMFNNFLLSNKVGARVFYSLIISMFSLVYVYIFISNGNHEILPFKINPSVLNFFDVF
ncbi:EpsG family protein [Acinetobacter pittii]|uniref:EpsG family protein n=1 Tax=Acinetobacter pittii TaxID=48296 RepID=UPI00290EC4B1|nr:EpsG family protein [Acinetobacter baumannii]